MIEQKFPEYTTQEEKVKELPCLYSSIHQASGPQ